MCYCMMTCSVCGHQGDLIDFTRTPIMGDLPPGQFQCPTCRAAIQLRAAGATRVIDCGNGEKFAFREKVEIVPCQATM